MKEPSPILLFGSFALLWLIVNYIISNGIYKIAKNHSLKQKKSGDYKRFKRCHSSFGKGIATIDLYNDGMVISLNKLFNPWVSSFYFPFSEMVLIKSKMVTGMMTESRITVIEFGDKQYHFYDSIAEELNDQLTLIEKTKKTKH